MNAHGLVSDLLSRFADDFNHGPRERMADYYAADFAVVVDGAFVARGDYLASIAQLQAAGYGGIRFEIDQARRLAADVMLAQGVTRIVDPAGSEQHSLFSIICVDAGAGLRFAHTHSSTPAMRS